MEFAELNQIITGLTPGADNSKTIHLLRAAAAAPPRADEDILFHQLFPNLSETEFQKLQSARDAIRKDLSTVVLNPAASKDRLEKLRAEMAREKIDGFIVPLNDEFHGEAAPLAAERLKWLTGFTGSAGVAAVLKDQAAIFVDGRYTLQVRNEVDTTLFTPRHVSEEPMTAWLSENMKADETLAIDPWLHTENSVKTLKKYTSHNGITLKSVPENPIDKVWDDRPQKPLALVVPHEKQFAGEESASKRNRIATGMAERNVDAVVHTLPDIVAWLLNIRGADLPCTPFALGFAITYQDATVDLFIDEIKFAPTMREHLGNMVRVKPPSEFEQTLAMLGGKQVQIDPMVTSQQIVDQLTNAKAKIIRGEDPCLLPKAIKNDTEINGTREAHIRDGAAVAKFLHWLSETATSGNVDELTAEAKLRSFRETGQNFRDLSFNTISGAGSNGAIVHYRASKATNKPLKPGSLYLVDSGAQYLDGTTDITRTIAIGEPSPEMRHRFTLVLKGHIAIATALFPKGTSGSQLDTLARAPLWAAGLDYDHGTGHGVGSYLSVHEGPQRISKAPSTVSLTPGMIISNEPGYYKTGAYGIRIENLVTVTKVTPPDGAERELYGFETLTFAPIDKALIDKELLSPSELNWLNNYHQQVREKLASLVEGDALAWLQEATAPL
ncbi:aminopeptidase P family protein [uncultured Sneathiella sp.]|uniref:aminopeptidase P family protein n=1 Tax=uncultured Sneathiella sp. TaxID=879315 RepID=UPI0030ECE902|tara:strand:- start:20443 stop:22446 length:2004 start_codon:yes stop_codon:yes gene_type:complete